MPVPYTIDGPHINRRALLRKRLALLFAAGLLLATPFIAAAVTAYTRG
ncbi:hypothetical protein [Acidovorax sp. SUPP2825]|nr:hypothetical protein [Acidovorax sp. SUPP2825]GKS96923.1 hypothetical protein AVAK2825_20330 [Acidovorax sp. SUPP2825]